MAVIHDGALTPNTHQFEVDVPALATGVYVIQAVGETFDVSRRFALNVSGGYLITRLRLTVLEDSSLVKQNQRGDTAIAHVGLAYRLF